MCAGSLACRRLATLMEDSERIAAALVVEDVGVDGTSHVPVGVHFAALAVVGAGGLLCGGHGGVPGDGLKFSGTIKKE